MLYHLPEEFQGRTCNRFNRLFQGASFPNPALVEEINMDPARGVEASLIRQLSTCDFIRDGRSVIITGATGTGKSYLALALGDRACRLGMAVAYFNMQRLLERLDLVRLQGHAIRFLDRLAKTDMRILDYFGMKKLQGQQQNDFEQLIDDRYRKKGLTITSQLPVKDLYDVIGNELISQACLDRLAYKSVRIQLKGESLRKNINFAPSKTIYRVARYHRKTWPTIGRNKEFFSHEIVIMRSSISRRITSNTFLRTSGTRQERVQCSGQARSLPISGKSLRLLRQRHLYMIK